jgi:hypothetical protein
MPLAPLPTIATWLLLLPGVAQSAAQVVSCHLEYWQEAPKLKRITLVNDSEKAIEAYRLVQHCEHTRGAGGGDIFDFPRGAISSMHPADGRFLTHSGLEHDETWEIGFVNTEGTGSDARECNPEVIAILFGDGTYEGNEDVVRAIKAARDGIRDSVKFWVERFAEDSANPNLEAISAEAQDRIRHERAEQDANPYTVAVQTEPLLHAYWSGRLQVDVNIEPRARTSGSRQTPAAQWQRLGKDIDGWKAKIADDQAMKVLDAEFPPISPDKSANEKAATGP